MTDRPIIFSAPMILALLDGRKTQTRRLAFRPTKGSDPEARKKGGVASWSGFRPSPWRKVQPGDRLWVRETWAPSEFVHGDGTRFFYRADADEDGTVPYLISGTPSGGGVGNARIERWHSPMRIPRRASRITLTVTDVRVQRLQEISHRDCLAEGIHPIGPEHHPDIPRREFSELWNRLHGAGAWDRNPEVVALTFTVRQGNIDA